MADYDGPRDAILEQIKKQAAGPISLAGLLCLAEAFAWLISPNNPHGGASLS